MKKRASTIRTILIIMAFAIVTVINIAALKHPDALRCMGVDIFSPADNQTAAQEISYDKGIAPPPVVISHGEKKIYVRDKYKLRVLSGASVTWESSDSEIASVTEDGTVTAIKSGIATITATDAEGNSDQCIINSQKVAYLTIDDNPTVSMTPKFIKLFDERDIKVTFFFCAQERNGHLYEQFYQAGHSIAMHGFSHNEGKIYASTEAFVNNIEAERKYLMKNTSAEYIQNVIRFPTGSGAHKDIRKVMLDKGFRVFDWTALFEDSYLTDADDCYNAVMAGIDSDCEIILMHHMVASYKALGKTIDTLEEMGYEFAPITEETAMWYF